MKANEFIKKLGNKLLGKKVNTLAVGECPSGVETAVQLEPDTKAPAIPLLDRLGVIQLHEHWRN